MVIIRVSSEVLSYCKNKKKKMKKNEKRLRAFDDPRHDKEAYGSTGYLFAVSFYNTFLY